MKSTNTKRALLMSVLSMMLCVVMLAGSTFAWFTDSVTTGANRIVAGNLNVELYYKNASTSDWQNASEASTADPTFFVDKDGGAILWEPGVMSVTQFKVVNEGSLALKYALATLKADFNALAGHDLSEVIKFAVIDNAAYTADSTRESILALNPTFDDFTEFKAEGTLLPKEKATTEKPAEEVFTVVAYWAPNANDVDNLYNVNNGQKTDDNADQLYIDIEIRLNATQIPHEKDSFDENYDSEAVKLLPTKTVNPEDDLKSFIDDAKEGDVIGLTAGTYEIPGFTKYEGKNLVLTALPGEKVTLNAELGFKGASKVVLNNIDMKANGPMLIEGTTEFKMTGGSLISNGVYSALITNGANTKGAKIELVGVTLEQKNTGDVGIAVYAPGEAEYIFRNCTFKGPSVFCGGTVLMEDCVVEYKNNILNFDSYNTINHDDKWTDGKNYIDNDEAIAAFASAKSGTPNLGDAMVFVAHREGYPKLTQVTMKNVVFNANFDNPKKLHLFDIRYIGSMVEGDAADTVFVMENVPTENTYNLPVPQIDEGNFKDPEF